MGLKKSTISLIYLCHLFVLILISSIIVFSLILLSANFLAPIVQKLIGFEFDFTFDFSFFLKSALLLVLVSLSVGIPLIRPLLQRKTTKFFKMIFWFSPFITLLLLISHFVTPSKNIGLFFSSAVLILILLFL